MKICSVEEIRLLDRLAVEKYGLSEEVLMENAGHAVYSLIVKFTGVKDKFFVVVCGTGNNGGDGLVVARKLYSNGGKVIVFVIGSLEKFKGVAKKNLVRVLKAGIKVIEITDEKMIKHFEENLVEADAVIDAIFGTGLSREVKGIHRKVIETINKYGKTVYSVDIPSGISGDSGKVMGVAVKATYTVTFGLPKLGNLLYPGYEYCGQLYVSHISYPPSISNAHFLKKEINIPVPLPPRKKTGHKGTFGKALFIAGAFGYFGAPYFSAMAFLKAGGGYSRLAAPRSIIPYIASKGSEIVFLPLEETEIGSISLVNKEKLLEYTENSDFVVMGPGLSLNEETQELVRQLVPEIKKPLLIDGDGLTAISKNLDIVRERKYPTILTPHPGEMARLTGKTVREIEENRVKTVEEAIKELKAIIVLKGAHTLIGYPDGRIYVNLSGNPGMATAGSGDVLTGTIAAMYGLGLDLETSVRIGVLIHGLAGDLAAEDVGEDGMTAQTILEYLPSAMKLYRKNFEKVLEKYSLKVI